ncbi:MAG: diacylglycerol kinase family protein [Bacteroidota bacterium]
MKQPGIRYALQGIAHSFRNQVNVRIHSFVAAAVIAAGFFLEISLVEWCIILICIGSVFAAELFNTSIENHVDLTHPDWNIDAGHTKDVAAGAVLIVALVSAIIGVIVFYPRVAEKFFH